MDIVRRAHLRAAFVALVAAGAAGGGAAYATTRAVPSAGAAGVVVINTNLAYQGSSAAGTGIVLTPSGQVLTNNHVIAGAAKILVFVPQTAETYAARVVGYDTAADI